MASGSHAILPRASAEVSIRRYRDLSDCDVVVSYGGKRLIVSCPNFEKALRWAKVECKTYRLPPVVAHSWFAVTPTGAVEITPSAMAQ